MQGHIGYRAWGFAAVLALAGCQSGPGGAPAAQATDGQQAYQQLQGQVGKYRGDAPFLQRGVMAARMQHLLGEHRAAFMQNMQVTGPLSKQGSVYYITGNRQHDGGQNAAAVALDAKSNTMRIWWLQDGQPRVVQDPGASFLWPRDVNTMISNAVDTPAS